MTEQAIDWDEKERMHREVWVKVYGFEYIPDNGKYNMRGPEGGVHQLFYMADPTEDLAAAWDVLKEMHGRTFSVRHAFYHALSEQARTENGIQISWPWALGVLGDRFPMAVCRAALAALAL